MQKTDETNPLWLNLNRQLTRRHQPFVDRRKSAAASPTKRMKRILMAEPEQAVNKKTFAIHTVVGDCSTANHQHEH